MNQVPVSTELQYVKQARFIFLFLQFSLALTGSEAAVALWLFPVESFGMQIASQRRQRFPLCRALYKTCGRLSALSHPLGSRE